MRNFSSYAEGTYSKRIEVVILALISWLTVSGYFKNISDWIKGTDVASSPSVTVSAALPAGTAIIGHVSIDQTTPGTTNGVQINTAIPAGTNNIGDVDVLTIPTIPAGTNLIGKVGIDQTADGTTNRTVSKISQIVGENVVAINCSSTTNNGTNYKLNSAASTNATSLKASAGKIHSLVLTNTSATIKYFKLYNKTSAPTVGTDTPIMVIGIPPLSTIPLGNSIGMYFSLGIAFATTGVPADTDTTALAANDMLVNIIYA